MPRPEADVTLDVQMLGTRGLPNRYGGSETCVEEVGRRLVDAGHRVRVFTRPRTTQSRAREYRGMELVAVPSLPVQVAETLTHSAAAIIWLALHRRRRSDQTVLHFHGSGNGAVLPLAKLFGLPTVVTVDGADWERAKWGPVARRLLRFAAGLTARLADVVVADSRQAVELYRQRWSCAPTYIPYGAPDMSADVEPDLRVLTQLGVAAQAYVLFVGRFVPEKEIHTLIEAHDLLARPRPKLVLVGGRRDESSYAERLADRAPEDVVFTGKLYAEDLDPLLRNALAYVQPSSVEGTSPMLLTAMAYGLPVVASDIPENRETVGESGSFFRMGSATDLERALSEVTGLDDQTRAKVGNALTARAQDKYDWDDVAASYVSAYLSALAPRELERRRLRRTPRHPE